MADSSDICINLVRTQSTLPPFRDKAVEHYRLVKTTNNPPPFHIGCPLTNNRSSWCNAFCVPVQGLGACGRIAPHALRGRTQRAIDAVERRQREC